MTVNYSKYTTPELWEYLRKASRRSIDLRNSRGRLAGSERYADMRRISTDLKKYETLHAGIRQELIDRGAL